MLMDVEKLENVLGKKKKKKKKKPLQVDIKNKLSESRYYTTLFCYIWS